jgi:hypothetical protein
MIDRAPAGTATRGRTGETALRGLAEALLVAGVSPALPGIAHLCTGRLRTGAALLAGQALALAAAGAAHGRRPVPAPPGSAWPAAAAAGCVLLAVLWAALIVHSYAVLAPAGLSPLLRLAGGTTVAVLCLLVVVPPLGAARALAPGVVRKIIPTGLTGTDSISWLTAVPEATPARMRSTPTQPLPGSARP